MATFVGRFENKVDAKGRMSVPSRFRAEIERQKDYRGIVVARSADAGALDACDYLRITEVSAALDDPELYNPKDRFEAENVISTSSLLPFDENGRVLVPQDLLAATAIAGSALFIGVGPTFQIWNPRARADFEATPFDPSKPAPPSLRLLPKARRPSA